MSLLEVNHGQFSDVIPDEARVGDEVTLTLTGRISRIEDDMIDATPMGPGPFVYLPGYRTTRIFVSEIRRA